MFGVGVTMATNVYIGEGKKNRNNQSGVLPRWIYSGLYPRCGLPWLTNILHLTREKGVCKSLLLFQHFERVIFKHNQGVTCSIAVKKGGLIIFFFRLNTIQVSDNKTVKWGSQICYGVCNRQAGNTQILPNRYLLPFLLDCAISFVLLRTWSKIKFCLALSDFVRTVH